MRQWAALTVAGALVLTSGACTSRAARPNAVPSSSASLPTGFPSSFPLPPDAALGSSYAQTAGGNAGYYVQLTTTSTIAAVDTFFQQQLPAHGWSVNGRYQAGGAGGTVQIQTAGRGYHATITISTEAAATSVLVILETVAPSTPPTPRHSPTAMPTV